MLSPCKDNDFARYQAMATISFLGGLVIGCLIGWFGLALLTLVTIKRRKRAAAKPLSHANDIPYTLVTLMIF